MELYIDKKIDFLYKVLKEEVWFYSTYSEKWLRCVYNLDDLILNDLFIKIPKALYFIIL